MASESTSVEGRSSKRARPRAVLEHDQRLDRIRADLMRLDLAPHVLDLELYGYTILPEVKPPAFCDQLRETILKLGEEDRIDFEKKASEVSARIIDEITSGRL